jgi:small basic protein
MIPVLGLIVGVVLGIVLKPDVPLWLQPYLPIAVVAGLDAVLGALRALFDGVFSDRVFVISFASNVVIAGVLVFLGDSLGVGSQISTGIVIILTLRIFSNVAAIRRHFFKA